MDGKQFRWEREKVYLTREELEALLHVEEGTIRRWEWDLQAIPMSAQHRLRILEIARGQRLERMTPEELQAENRRTHQWNKDHKGED